MFVNILWRAEDIVYMWVPFGSFNNLCLVLSYEKLKKIFRWTKAKNGVFG